MSENDFQEVTVLDGYALWASSYDQEKNGLIYLEERAVARMLGPLAFSAVLGVPLIFGAELPAATAMPKAGSEAANLPSLTLITMFE